MTASDDPQMIRRAAMDLLARREHSHAELERKLARRFGDSELIAAALVQLADENLQSDERYAQSFARQRIQRGYGPLRLRQEMRQKGLDEAEVSRALASLDVDWQAVAAEVYHKKFGDAEPQDLKDKSRRLRFMQYRGFSSEQFSHLME
ncbi:regulatory protein RecX [Parahaliea mediterranea]|uniref:Regulatory protein RecX n=1 Tax=Parahaliea mediterranea TaxID=651086 RepID=A0A939ILQ5_9GAMM|nr:regulatory protein RecX [Parahaliea mediterranea]MBN7796740.1 regulatory protein RecX [Parahaliea mediterranea]